MKKLIDINTKFFEKLERISPRSMFIHLWFRSFFYQIAIGCVLFSMSSISWDNKQMLMFIPWYAFIEEVFFRHLPFFFIIFPVYRTLFYTDKRRFYLRSSIVILISSVIFGYLHGGYEHILLQGVGGVFLFLIYLRYFIHYNEKYILTGGSALKPIYMPLIMATLFHSIYNYVVVLMDIVL